MEHLIVLMGVSGCGKTSVGTALAELNSLPFFDADDYHPQSNKQKMQSGIPLEDQDRIPWLERLNQLMKSHKDSGMVLACSALKQSYRVLLSKDIQIKWVYLRGDFELIYRRMADRKDHFMPERLLQSQFDILEEPKEAVVVDIDQSVESIVLEIQEQL
jgi:carbohydrate kinase (thermoresistant glucokinase family)